MLLRLCNAQRTSLQQYSALCAHPLQSGSVVNALGLSFHGKVLMLFKLRFVSNLVLVGKLSLENTSLHSNTLLTNLLALSANVAACFKCAEKGCGAPLASPDVAFVAGTDGLPRCELHEPTATSATSATSATINTWSPAHVSPPRSPRTDDAPLRTSPRGAAVLTSPIVTRARKGSFQQQASQIFAKYRGDTSITPIAPAWLADNDRAQPCGIW